MGAYAEMVQQALATHPEVPQVSVINLLDGLPGDHLLPKRLKQRLSQLWLLTYAGQRLNRIEADVYHLLDGSFAYALKRFHRKPLVVTVHDLIPVLQAEGKFPVSPPGQLARWLIQRNLEALQRQRYFCADSEATAHDLRQRVPSTTLIDVVPLAIRDSLMVQRPLKIKAWEDRQVQGERYLFHIGNNGFYKNRQTVARVFIELAKEYPVKLVMAGAPPDEMIEQLLKDFIRQDKVIFVPYPDDTMLAQLYEQASILLFPSYYEGFGWPPVEAMAFGCPVVCSNTGSLPEVVGQAALMDAPNDVKGLAQHCRELLENHALVNQKVELGLRNIERFSHKKLASQLSSVYRKVKQDA